jgi:outer membrane protein
MMRKFASFALLGITTAFAQVGGAGESLTAALAAVAGLPSAPVAQLAHPAADSPNIPAGTQAGPAPTNAHAAAPQTTAPSVPGAEQLSIKDAEQLALKNNPQISVAKLNALASQQVAREQRSALWPTAMANITAVDSEPNSRITAGGLNNPIIYERAAVGASVTQLITDFGRTSNLVSSARLAAKAQDQNALATEEQIRLATDQAFYSALQSHSITQVAQQTLNARQAVADQIQALFNSKLKSQLDLSFANVNLSQSKLLLLDAQNNENASRAALSAVLGFANLKNYQLVEDTTPLVAPTENVDDLISQAFAQRPELLALGFEYQSAQKFQSAERDLLLPSIRAAGAIGDTPVRNPVLSNWYGAVGVNIDIPIFNGFLYSAKAREASLRSQAANERVRDERNRISRDVRTSWLNAGTAYSRLSVTQELLNQSNLALDLAQTRYKLGLSSIVELSQAQLQQTQAEIGNAQASYDYRLALAVLRYETGVR